MFVSESAWRWHLPGRVGNKGRGWRQHTCTVDTSCRDTVGGPTPRPSEWQNGRRARGSTPAQSTARAVILWAARPRGPVCDGKEDGPEAAHLHSRHLVRDTVATGGKTGLKQHSSKQFVILALARRTWAPAVTGPGVSREHRFSRRLWDEGVEVTASSSLPRALVALVRHVLGCPSRLPDRAGREPLAAILPAPVKWRCRGSSASCSRR